MYYPAKEYLKMVKTEFGPEGNPYTTVANRLADVSNIYVPMEYRKRPANPFLVKHLLDLIANESSLPSLDDPTTPEEKYLTVVLSIHGPQGNPYTDVANTTARSRGVPVPEEYLKRPEQPPFVSHLLDLIYSHQKLPVMIEPYIKERKYLGAVFNGHGPGGNPYCDVANDTAIRSGDEVPKEYKKRPLDPPLVGHLLDLLRDHKPLPIMTTGTTDEEKYLHTILSVHGPEGNPYCDVANDTARVRGVPVPDEYKKRPLHTPEAKDLLGYLKVHHSLPKMIGVGSDVEKYLDIVYKAYGPTGNPYSQAANDAASAHHIPVPKEYLQRPSAFDSVGVLLGKMNSGEIIPGVIPEKPAGPPVPPSPAPVPPAPKPAPTPTPTPTPKPEPKPEIPTIPAPNPRNIPIPVPTLPHSFGVNQENFNQIYEVFVYRLKRVPLLLEALQNDPKTVNYVYFCDALDFDPYDHRVILIALYNGVQVSEKYS